MVDLARYASSQQSSKGRRFFEPVPLNRTDYQRDRDRIIHSAAFRRLEYKTQVFVNHEGDMFRTRLTHSLEVAQIGRSIARTLQLNEDLTEAIALSHDLGHTPFGHAGQDALNQCMGEFGGFEHNLQSLRVVDELEERYAEFSGLNLTFETREGILKHCAKKNALQLGDVGQRFINNRQPSLEAQLANIADEIAYNNHDVDDGLRSGLITVEQLREVPLFAGQYDVVKNSYPDLVLRRVIHEVVRRMINAQVSDLINTSSEAIKKAGPEDVGAVRSLERPLISYSDPMKERNLELKQFLRRELYQHYRVHRMSAKAKGVIKTLFDMFMADPKLLPPAYRQRTQVGDSASFSRATVIADYIAGMTDRFAIIEHNRLVRPEENS